MGAAPGAAAPLASVTQVSLVEVSESTVILLKLTPTASRRICERCAAAMGASVVTMAIMVAMFGMIMPEPFDMPPTVKVTPSKPSSSPEKLTAYSFGCVSVVMIARAAEAPPSRLASANA